MREVFWNRERLDEYSNGLQYEYEGDQDYLKESKPKKLALAPSFNELQTSAAKDIPSIEMVFCKLLATQPAPLIVAARACDVIAFSFLSFSSGLALGTLCKVVVVGCVVVEFCLIVVLFLAGSIRVPGLATLEAHLIATLTDRWHVLLLGFLNVAETARLGTPSEFRVEIDNDVLMEA